MRRLVSLAIPLSVVVVALLMIPGGLATGASGAGQPGPSDGTSASAGSLSPPLTLEAGNQTSPLLFGTTVTARALILPGQSALVNATPARTVVWPGGDTGDWYDPLADFEYSSSDYTLNSSPNGLVYNHFNPANNRPSPPLTSEKKFVAWCETIGCQGIFQVPGQIDNPSIAMDIVEYTVNQTYTGPVWQPNGTEINVTINGLDYRPAYWEIGNEPELWQWWGEPWNHINFAQPSPVNVTPLEYAQEVAAYIPAMDQANASYLPKIIGLPGAGKGNGKVSSWIDAVINMTGSEIAGIAIHLYPNGADPSFVNGSLYGPTMAEFYAGLLSGSASLRSRILSAESTVIGDCRASGCHLPIFDTEIGTALSHDLYGPYASMFPGALGAAVQATEMLSLAPSELATADVFAAVSDSNNSWFNLTGVARPSYVTYSDILSHLGSDAFPVGTGGDLNVSAVATIAQNGSDRHDLLIVNTDVNHTLTINTSFINGSNSSLPSSVEPAAFAPGAPVEIWTWNGTNVTVVGTAKPSPTASNVTLTYNSSIPSTAAPVPHYFPNGLPPNFALPPQSLALFETYNAPAYPVEFTEAGLTLGWTSATPRWFLDVDGTDLASNSTNITLLLPPGVYSPIGIPLTLPANWSVPLERWEPFAPATVTVLNSAVPVPIPYSLQWAVAVAWMATGGSVVLGTGPGPPPSWWNASQPLTLTARPLAGSAFTGWSGQGPGSFQGYNFTATIVPTGPIYEEAIFSSQVTKVVFQEQGLTPGTPWSISLRGLESSSTTPTQTFYEIEGTWQYQVTNVTGYHLNESNETKSFGSVNLTGKNSITVAVVFDRYYSVSFQERGLAPGSAWSLQVVGINGSVWSNSSADGMTFYEINGTWGFQASSPGYHVNESSQYGSLHVTGPDLRVQVVFEKVYSVVFDESGLASGQDWTIGVTGVNGTFWSNSTANAKTFFEVDGVWAYRASSPQYHVNESVDYGSVTVAGGDLTVTITFEFLYSVVFVESGLPPGTPWNLTLVGVTGPESNNSSAPSKTFLEIDGPAWGYQVGAIAGFHLESTPGFGSVDVANSDVAVSILYERLHALVFDETGLPSGTTWTVQVFGVSGPASNSTTTSAMTFDEPDGIWAFGVTPVPGYHVEGTAGFGSVTVADANTSFTVVFDRLYPVLFDEQGLPAGVTWDVATRLGSEGLSGSASSPTTISLSDVNGSYGFRAWAVGSSTISWRVTSPLFFSVANASVTITVEFALGYLIYWEETGLGPNLTWSVHLNGGTNASTPNAPGWVQTDETNGTYAFAITGAQDYVAIPRLGQLVVDGGSVIVSVVFVRATVPVTFEFTGLPDGGQVHIRLSTLNDTAVQSSFTFQIPNSTYQDGVYDPTGQYSFNITAPNGYYATPAGGNVTVNGGSVNVTISILPIGRGPIPPFWTLVLPAAGAASAVGVSGLAMFAVLGAIRRHRTGASPTAATTSRTGAPP